jgi:hypothetical protein
MRQLADRRMDELPPGAPRRCLGLAGAEIALIFALSTWAASPWRLFSVPPLRNYPGRRSVASYVRYKCKYNVDSGKIHVISID